MNVGFHKFNPTYEGDRTTKSDRLLTNVPRSDRPSSHGKPIALYPPQKAIEIVNLCLAVHLLFVEMRGEHGEFAQ
jgi:hypothetical protein